MSLKNDRIVITGLGALSPLGRDVASTWEGLLAGKSGVTRLPEDWSPDIPAQIAAKVAVEPAELMDRVEMRRLDRSEQFAVIAAREAWADAGSPDVDPTRLGVVIASGIGGVLTLLGSYDVLKDKLGQYLICCSLNDSCVGLTWTDGVTLSEKENTFFIGK